MFFIVRKSVEFFRNWSGNVLKNAYGIYSIQFNIIYKVSFPKCPQRVIQAISLEIPVEVLQKFQKKSSGIHSEIHLRIRSLLKKNPARVLRIFLAMSFAIARQFLLGFLLEFFTSFFYKFVRHFVEACLQQFLRNFSEFQNSSISWFLCLNLFFSFFSEMAQMKLGTFLGNEEFENSSRISNVIFGEIVKEIPREIPKKWKRFWKKYGSNYIIKNR